ncbi:MAG: aldehyde ferredoxin oxidoreductase, partial [Spirochaetales bacterium]
LIRSMALKQGPGAEAALGTKVLSEKYGGKDFAMHIKGLELPGYDPRGSWAMGIAYASAPRGGCHMTAYPIAEEAWGKRDPFTFEGKAQLVADMQNAQFAKFSMGVCDFWPISSSTLGRMFEVTYGGNWPAEKVDQAGERIFNLQRVYNIMAGFDAASDTLPRRLFTELLKAGPPMDRPMTEEAFKACMLEYYGIRGWTADGKPTVEKLGSLDMEPELIERYRKTAGL